MNLKEKIAIAIQPLGESFFVLQEKNKLIVTDGKTKTLEYEESENSPKKVFRVYDIKFSEVANQLAKEENAVLIVAGRQLANYETLTSITEATRPETVVKKKSPSFLLGEDIQEEKNTPQELGVSAEMIERIKKEFCEEIPKMISGINDHFGDKMKPEIRVQLQQIVTSTATTASLITLRIISKILKEKKE